MSDSCKSQRALCWLLPPGGRRGLRGLTTHEGHAGGAAVGSLERGRCCGQGERHPRPPGKGPARPRLWWREGPPDEPTDPPPPAPSAGVSVCSPMRGLPQSTAWTFPCFGSCSVWCALRGGLQTQTEVCRADGPPSREARRLTAPQLPCLSSDTAEAGVPQCPRPLGGMVKPKKRTPNQATLRAP